jgi:hypothetical protein
MSNHKRKTYTLYVLHLPILLLALSVALLAYLSYLGDNKCNSRISILGSKSNKGEETNGSLNSGKNKNKESAKTENSRKYKENITKVVNKLDQVAKLEEEIGNTETSDEVQKVAETEEENVDNVANAIEAVESRSKWKTLLIGSDYKNLGQLRSNLIHITNSIRKLSANTEEVVEETNQTQLQQQLQALMNERTRIIDVIVANKEHFSLLGWVVKLFSGESAPPLGGIDDTEETTESTSGIDTTDNLNSGSSTE